MRGEEIEDRAEHGGIVQAGAQGFRGEPGQVQQPLGPAFAGEKPAERAERECLRIGGG